MAPLVAHPLVVLGIPVYNESNFIRQTLQSIQDQTHSDFAVLISDNASSDGTSEICKEFADSDPRFIYLRQNTNLGSAANFRFVRSASDSPFFAWIGAHDLLSPTYLQEHIESLSNHRDVGNSFTYFEYISSENKTISRDRSQGIGTPRFVRQIRYIWSVAIGAENGPIHGLFRRSKMSSLPLRGVLAGDHIFLSSSVYNARFLHLAGHLYRIRQFDEKMRAEDCITRITGQSHVVPDMQRTIDAYLADFDLLYPIGTSGRIMRPFVCALLNDRLGKQKIRFTKLFRSIVKRTHSIRYILRKPITT